MMQSRIGMWGGSCAIRLPKMAVESLGLHEGEHVTLLLQDGALILRPAKKQYTLDELIEQAKGLQPPDVIDDQSIGDELL